MNGGSEGCDESKEDPLGNHFSNLEEKSSKSYFRKVQRRMPFEKHV